MSITLTTKRRHVMQMCTREGDKMKLEVELIPRSSFFTNLRSELSKEKWDVLRKKCYSNAGYRCEICSGKGEDWPVECHEVWSYKGGIQKLMRLIALCPACHMVKHFGLAKLQGNGDKALTHLMTVNKISKQAAEAHISEAFETWHDRNQVNWILDISSIEEK